VPGNAKTTRCQPPLISDDAIARSLRQGALALVEAIPAKIEGAPLNQVAAALKTAVELIKVLEAPDAATQEQSTPEQVIRWEFVYNGDEPPGAVSGRGVRAAVGQDGAGQGSAA
jgi:hypothetical protein